MIQLSTKVMMLRMKHFNEDKIVSLNKKLSNDEKYIFDGLYFINKMALELKRNLGLSEQDFSMTLEEKIKQLQNTNKILKDTITIAELQKNNLL